VWDWNSYPIPATARAAREPYREAFEGLLELMRRDRDAYHDHA